MSKPWSAKPMPSQHKTLMLDGAYSAEEFEKIQKGFLPKTLKDKWVIFFRRNTLHFFRSRTGTCIYQLVFEKAEDQNKAIKAIVNRAPEQYRSSDDEYDVAMIAYLVDTLLLGRFAPLPKPKGLRDEDFNQYKKDVLGEDEGGSINLKMI